MEGTGCAGAFAADARAGRLRFALNRKEVCRVRSEPPEVLQENDAKLSGLPGTLVNCGNKFGGDGHLRPQSLRAHIPLDMRIFLYLKQKARRDALGLGQKAGVEPRA